MTPTNNEPRSTSLQVGMLVVCVDDSGWTERDRRDWIIPVMKEIYRIRRLGISSINGKPILLLEEIVNPRRLKRTEFGGECGWRTSRFRAVSPVRQAEFEHLVKPRVLA